MLFYYLRRRRRLCFWFSLFVCLFVCLSVGLLANLWTDFDEIFWMGRAWLKDQVIQFWWRSGSRFGSGSPKSEIRILRIGGCLCSLSTSSFSYDECYGDVTLLQQPRCNAGVSLVASHSCHGWLLAPRLDVSLVQGLPGGGVSDAPFPCSELLHGPYAVQLGIRRE